MSGPEQHSAGQPGALWRPLRPFLANILRRWMMLTGLVGLVGCVAGLVVIGAGHALTGSFFVAVGATLASLSVALGERPSDDMEMS